MKRTLSRLLPLLLLVLMGVPASAQIKERQRLRPAATSDPANVTGDCYMNLTTDKLRCRSDNGAWADVGNAGTVTGTGTTGRLAQWSSSSGVEASNVTIAGPTAARTVTLPDANFTAARTDAAQTFTGLQTFTPSGAAVTPILIKGFASQSANLFEIQKSTSTTPTFLVDSFGRAVVNPTLTGLSTDTVDAGLTVNSRTAGTAALIVAGVGTTTGDIVSVRNGSNVPVFNLTAAGKPVLYATNTAAGTTGAQTIDRPSGTVNVAAGGTSVTVTNSTCTANSIVHAVIRTNDATARIKNVVPTAGSFTINLEATTNEVSIGFVVFN